MPANLVGRKCPSFGADRIKWLKGEPTPVPVPGRPTVVELWASWCGPCRQVFPHLSQLQREYAERGLVVVGVSIEEHSPGLAQFVARQGDKMAYRVAQSEQLGAELMGAAQVSGVPHSLVVDCEGIIQFSGHPADPAFAAAIKAVTAAAKPEPKALPRITARREDLAALPVRELKQILSERGISYVGLAEKGELVERILETCQDVTYFAKA